MVLDENLRYAHICQQLAIDVRSGKLVPSRTSKVEKLAAQIQSIFVPYKFLTGKPPSSQFIQTCVGAHKDMIRRAVALVNRERPWELIEASSSRKHGLKSARQSDTDPKSRLVTGSELRARRSSRISGRPVNVVSAPGLEFALHPKMVASMVEENLTKPCGPYVHSQALSDSIVVLVLSSLELLIANNESISIKSVWPEWNFVGAMEKHEPELWRAIWKTPPARLLSLEANDFRRATVGVLRSAQNAITSASHRDIMVTLRIESTEGGGRWWAESFRRAYWEGLIVGRHFASSESYRRGYVAGLEIALLGRSRWVKATRRSSR